MKQRAKNWTVLELLNFATEYLENKNVENARLNVEWLLSKILDLNRVQLYLNFQRPVIPAELQRFKELLQRRAKQEPLQYILGSTEFMALPFKVNPNVLVPRPETEILVESVIEVCQEKFSSNERITILEIGTGSGCIAVSLAKNINGCDITAIDISQEALDIAVQNAELNNQTSKIHFMKTDFRNQTTLPHSSYDIIVSNPPYISKSDFEQLPEEIKNYEPTVALMDNADGLSFYRQIGEYCPAGLNPGGLVFVEVGLGQAQKVKELFVSNRLSSVNIIKDLNGIERVVCAEYEQSN